MNEYCVVVADALRARLFTLEPAKNPAFQTGPKLKEQKGLLNSEMEDISREMHTNTRSGANRARGTAARATDDHREKHVMECEKRFARMAAAEVAKIVEAARIPNVVLCASARMLGYLRKEFPARRGVELHDVPRDMTKLTPAGIHAHLAKAGLLPAEQKKSRTWRSCAQSARRAAARA